MNLLQGNKELLNRIVDSLPFKFYIVDRDMNVVAWNKKGEEGPYGVRQDDAVGRPLKSVFRVNRDRVASPKAMDSVDREFREVFDKGTVFSIEDISVLKSGEKRYYRVTKTPLFLEGGTVSHVGTIIEDLTEKRRQEASLIARERLFPMEELAAGIAHQINNPLSTMMVCVESLLNEIKNDIIGDPGLNHKFEKYLDLTYKEILRCKNISNILTNLGKGSTDEIVRTDINSLVTETLDILSMTRRNSGCTIEKDLEETLPCIPAKEHLLRQAFAAIILNAFEAMANTKEGLLRISTSTSAVNDEKMIVVRCADNGSGMEEAHLKRIFTPFFTTKGGSRIGLGLYVACGIVAEHGGKIEVESGTGKGAVFTVTLPVRRKEANKNDR